jgi:hypothetical protein
MPEVGKGENSKILTQFWCLLNTSSKREFLSARCTSIEICVVQECVIFSERDEAYGGCGLKVEINSVIQRRYGVILSCREWALQYIVTNSITYYISTGCLLCLKPEDVLPCCGHRNALLGFICVCLSVLL